MSSPYHVILADPPWSYSNSGTRGAALNEYKTMTIDDICALPVQTVAADDCILLLWATNPLIPEALKVCNAWGFKYVTVAFVWNKRTVNGNWVHNMGRWTMGNMEMVLLAKKGKPQRVRKDIKQLVIAERKEHSKKPDIIRKAIVDLMGDLPRIELFARGDKNKDMFDFNRFDGWDTFGNESEGSISITAAGCSPNE